MLVETHWPEGARICDLCNDIIEAGHTFWFEDEEGTNICEDCNEKLNRKMEGK